MRVDVLTIFPDYLTPLELSLVGKARRAGLLDLAVHDLRDWTTDRHRTVDDTPFGGGAGMVMRPDVWGAALDAVLDDEGAGPGSGDADEGAGPGSGGADEGARPGSGGADEGAGPGSGGADEGAGPGSGGADEGAGPGAGDADAAAPLAGRTVLLVPTPAGEVLTQRAAEELAGADRLVVACGRYEGIDARVAEHYATRPDVVVREVSIGDYVLNGGEVAALVVIEAVARLLPGVVGNPESLVEESHGAAGLLEHPVYTKPPEWRGHAVPEVLISGHHGNVARWRRDRAIERTAVRRPDLLTRLAPASLDRDDRRVLAGLGWYVGPAGPRRAVVRPARPDDAAELAELAAVTFPLACPPSLAAEAIAEFVATRLDEASFAGYLADSRRVLHVAADAADGRLLGYTMVVIDSPSPTAPQEAGWAELSKCYVHAEVRGGGLAARLLAEATAAAAERGAARVWLGTNVANRRARRFYERCGFAVVGRRTIEIGGEAQDDVVMSTSVPAP